MTSRLLVFLIYNKKINKYICFCSIAEKNVWYRRWKEQLLLDTYDLLKTAMNVSAQRAELISSNIANVNTDGYKAKRIVFESELKQALASSGTDAATEASVSQVKPKITENATTSIKDNGNNVDLEVEMLDQAANGLYYSALTAQVNGRLLMMNLVLSN